MALVQEIQVPLLAVNDTTLTVAEISLPGGSAVKKGDLIMVFETSKTTYDVEAGADGYVVYLCSAGNDYEVNTVVAKIYSEKAEALAVPQHEGTPTSPSAAGNRADMAAASAGAAQPAGAAHSARAAHPPTGAHPGSGSHPARANGDAGSRSAVVAQPQPLPYWEGKTIFSHEALRLIETAGLDRGKFAGRDFVNAAEVRAWFEPASAAEPSSAAASSPIAAPSHAAASSRVSASPASAPASAATPPLPADPALTVLRRLATSKKREIEYLRDVQSPGLTSTLHIQVETQGIFTHINQALKYLKDSLLPVIIYETARLLADYPLLNGYFTGDAIAVYKEVNPGFAIDIENKGLKVLKIAQGDQKNIAEIETEILRLSGDYLDEKIQLTDMTDITFTITDLAAEGVAFFQPLINKMNSAILGVSAIDEKLQRCMLSLTFDHRVTEGKNVAGFLRELKERLESYRPADAELHKDIACFKCYKTLSEDLGGTGLVRCITPEGKEGYICQSCLKGF